MMELGCWVISISSSAFVKLLQETSATQKGLPLSSSVTGATGGLRTPSITISLNQSFFFLPPILPLRHFSPSIPE